MIFRFLIIFLFLCSSAFATNIASVIKTKVVIVGSYRKYYNEVLKAIEEFERHGYEVIMPPKSKIINPGADYVRFEGDSPNIPMRLIELSFLDAVKRADLIYVVNPKGYIGLSGALEIGYAFYAGKPIFCAEKPADPNLEPFCRVVD